MNKECDKTLIRIDSTYREDVITLRRWFYAQVEAGGNKIDFDTILSILLVDGFIKDVEQSGVWYTITATGKAFIAKSSYEKRGNSERLAAIASERDNWKKKYWHLIAIATYVLGYLSKWLLEIQR